MSTRAPATAARWRSRRCLGRCTTRSGSGRGWSRLPGMRLLVSGVVTRNMADPLRNTVAATPQPRVVIACGDCALNRGVFRDGYGVVGAVGEVVGVDVEIPGCPPTPTQIVAALRSVTGK